MTSLKWRYATKKFNADVALKDEQIQYLIESIRMAPTSYGLQPFHVHVISDRELMSSLTPASYGQAQLASCSHLFVFSTINKLDNAYVDKYVENMATIRNVNADSIEAYSNTMKGFLSTLSEVEKKEWAKRQAYLAMGFLLAACAESQIDSCPMEGFISAEYDRILNLEEQGLSSAVVVPVGIRSDEDLTQHAKKVRKEQAHMFDFV
jgi:nitroreductase